jgi:hypothetical protein
MEAQGNAEYRLKIELTDEQLLSADQAVLMKAHFLPGEKIYYKDPAEATRKFVALCDHHIKYLRTSTEDLRNHVVLTPVGWIDCYQYLLLLADQSSYFAEKINQVKSSRGFPKK